MLSHTNETLSASTKERTETRELTPNQL